MKITVIGCGRWGSFIAWYLNKIGHSVILYGTKTSKTMQTLKETGTNGLLVLPKEIELCTDLEKALDSEFIVISIPSQSMRNLLKEMKMLSLPLASKKFVLCMKGLEIGTGKRLSQVFEDEMGTDTKLAVWIGPGHVQDFVQGIPNCMVIDSKNDSYKEELIQALKGPLIRFYYGSDLVGNEIGAAAKNVIGIAAGILDGIGRGSLKGALMSRGTSEISRLIGVCGGNPISAYGLCHLGDYEATLFSPHSHNRIFGEKFAKGEEYSELAEGYYTAKAIMHLSETHQVELPICSAVYRLLHEKSDIEEELNNLFLRSLKKEFY